MFWLKYYSNIVKRFHNYLIDIFIHIIKDWQEEANDMYCPNSIVVENVANQGECQLKCVTVTSCVGICYSHRDTSNRICYLCNDDDLKSSSNNFGFYRRNSKNKVYANLESCIFMLVVRNLFLPSYH